MYDSVMNQAVARGFVDIFTVSKTHPSVQGTKVLSSNYMLIPEKHLSVSFISSVMANPAVALNLMGVYGKAVYHDSSKGVVKGCGIYFIPKEHIVKNGVLKNKNSHFYVLIRSEFSAFSSDGKVEIEQIKSPEFFHPISQKSNTKSMMLGVAMHIVNGIVKNNMDPMSELHAIAKYGAQYGVVKSKRNRPKSKDRNSESKNLLDYLRKSA